MHTINHTNIKKLILSIYKHSEMLKLPIDIIEIIKTYNNCKIVTYREHMNRFKLSYNEMIEFTGSKEACTLFDSNTEKYIIFYNNLNADLIKSYRYRWSIAHEFGHIMLNHFKFHKLSLINNCIEADEYDIFEKQANIFAAFILVPFSLLNLYKVREQIQLKKYCEISYEATKNNYVSYLHWKSDAIFRDWYDDEIIKLYYEISNKKINIINFNEEAEVQLSHTDNIDIDTYLKQLSAKYKLVKDVFKSL